MTLQDKKTAIHDGYSNVGKGVPMRAELSAFITLHWPDVQSVEDFVTKVLDAFPDVDVLSETKKARLWEKSQRCQKKNHQRFLTNWLLHCQSRDNYRSSPESQAEAIERRLSSERARRAIANTKSYLYRMKTIKTTPPREAVLKAAEIIKKLGG
jgi:hypothetical protein